MSKSDLSHIYISGTESTLLSRLPRNNGAGKCSIGDLFRDCWWTRSLRQESKLRLLGRPAVFSTTAPASCQWRFNCVTAALCSRQSRAQAPFIVPSIINKEWKAPGEQPWRCRQYQSTQKCKSHLWQWGQMYFNFSEPDFWAALPPWLSS